MARARWDRPQPVREESADDKFYRMLEDRRGFVVRSGHDYQVKDARLEVKGWCVRYAVRGRTDQFEGIYDGRVVKRGGSRVVDTSLKRRCR